MAMTLAELRAVADSLAPRLVGGQLQRVQQRDHETVVLQVRGWNVRQSAEGPEQASRGGGHTWTILACLRPRESRVHLVDARPPNLDRPPGFTQRLRKEVQNGYVDSVELPWPDRVLVLGIVRAESRFRLVFELTGHHPNAFLLDAAGTILASLRSTASRRRDLRPGKPYEPPLEPSQAPVASRGTTPDLDGLALHEELARRYELQETRATHDRRAHEVGRALRKALARARRKKGKIAADLARADGAELWRHRGELLKAHLYEVRPGMDRLRVADYADPGSTVEIPLRPELSPQANLAAIFGRYRKLSNARAPVEKRLAATTVEVTGLEELAEELEHVRAPEEATAEAIRAADVALARVAHRAARHGVGIEPADRTSKSRKDDSGKRRPYRSYVSADGTEILVGKGGVDNGTLTFRVARDNDMWLHVRDGAGAHVVVRRQRKGQSISREALLDAGSLAAHFSKRRGDTHVEVHLTPRRFVRPIRGGRPGSVRVERSETILVPHDEARLTRLLGSADRST